MAETAPAAGAPVSAHPRSHFHRMFSAAALPLPGSRPGLRRGSRPIHGLDAPPIDQGTQLRRRLYGRLAGVFFAGSGILGLVTLPLPAPGSNLTGTAVVSAAALVLGIVIWLAPWDVWPRRASLAILPPAFALIALGNLFGGSSQHAYGVFFVVAFVWIGLAHPPWTSLAVAPFAAAAYIFPLFTLPGDVTVAASSTALTIPICVLVGEGLAWGTRRRERIELALQGERDRAEQLRELDRMKNAFLSAVSHELRTPITICRGHLEVLEEDSNRFNVRKVTETLVDELDRMARIVDDITTLVRVEDREFVKVEPLQLDKFLAGIATKAEPILGDRLRLECLDCDATIRADPQRLTQALLNLLQNARDRGSVELRVRKDSGAWYFAVIDEGGGLPPGEERLVFEPFRKGSTPTGRSGLGLAIVRGIARAHGGAAGVLNRPGHGATFWVRIPA